MITLKHDPTFSVLGHQVAAMIMEHVKQPEGAMPMVVGCGHKNEYNPSRKEITLAFGVWFGDKTIHLCIASHEAMHVVQHSRWPFLFWLRRLIFFGWFVNLFLEWHASYAAMQWMKKYLSLTESDQKDARMLFKLAFNTYLL